VPHFYSGSRCIANGLEKRLDQPLQGARFNATPEYQQKCPAIAAAAAIAGETRMGAAFKNLAALKLRFEVEAQRSPGAACPGSSPGTSNSRARATRIQRPKISHQVPRLLLLLDEARPRHDHGVDGARDMLTRDHLGGGAQILDPAMWCRSR